VHTKCKGCQLKQPHFGLPAEGKAWSYAKCAKAHAGAKDTVRKKCEDCQLKSPNFGMPSEGKAWWCAKCAKAHAGVVDVANKKCEGCGRKQPMFGLPAEGKTRWCSKCAKAHVGAKDVADKKCEDCTHWRPSFGLAAEGDMRWCASCARAHGGVVNIKTGNPPSNSARSKAEKIQSFKLPSQTRFELEDMKKDLQQIKTSENALKRWEKSSPKNIQKVRHVWHDHLLAYKDASSPIMCSLLSDAA
jgi:hypothetical protein